MRNRTENQIKLVWIRHGATPSNLEHRYVGRTEESLSREGVRALREYQREALYPKAGLVFSSPMKRCLETAGILYPKSAPVIIPEWKEMDFGAFEGKNYRELQQDGRYQEWIDSYGTLPFPEGESRETFAGRCELGFQKMLAFLRRSGGDGIGPDTVCAVVHGGTMMALLSRYGGGDYFDYQVSNGEGYQCLLQWSESGVSEGVQNLRMTDLRKIRRQLS